METTARHPLMSSQYLVCPIPYRLDPYVGCTFGCRYCFARDTIQNVRRVCKKQPGFNYLVGLDLEHFRKWVVSSLTKESPRPERIAFKERIPLKLGTMADPFPYTEPEARYTYGVLKILHEIDYPVQMSTKNPAGLAAYVKDFENPNWAVNVTIISPDETFRKMIEPGAPTLENRLQGIRELTDHGLKVLVRVQPVIYPYILTHIEELLQLVKAAGAYGILLEGLKIRVSMDKAEQECIREISNYLGYDLRQWYRENGLKTRSDYELTTAQKLEYITLARELCRKYNIALHVGDNQPECRSQSCSGECCGTHILRQHKTLRESSRLLDCKIDFVRTTEFNRHNPKTIREALSFES